MKKKEINNLAVMVSGGRSSAMMAYHIFTHEKYKKYNKVFVFCNTSAERLETIEFLKDMKKHWGIPVICLEGVYSIEAGIGVKSIVVDIDDLKMDGSVFSNAIKQVNKYETKGVPNSAIPYCSSYLKTRVAHDFCRKFFGKKQYIKAIGYRREDMPKRITFAELRENNLTIAPLLTDFDLPVGMLELNDFYKRQNFKLQLHSSLGNCQLCFKKSTPNLLDTINLGSTLIKWADNEEKKYNNTFFRENRSIGDLVKLAESGVQVNLFDELEDSCVCNF